MIRLVIQYCHRPVDLFDKDKPYHLVRESHFAERYLFGGCFVDSFAEPIGASDYKYQTLGYDMHLLFQIGRELHGCKFLSFFI